MNINYQDLPLGKQTVYSDQYDPSLLVAVPRAQTRDFWPENDKLPFHGSDTWTAYELSWLNDKGKPEIATALFIYSASSPSIVESKSLKLYLNALNQSAFSSFDKVTAIIASDLSQTVGAEVNVLLLPAHHASATGIQDWNDTCIDDLDIAITQYTPDATLLETHTNTLIEESVCSHLLRSNCPVTGQPDWASVRIHYRGAKISHDSLLRYICSFRLHQGFHEQCIERIFCDIWQQCQPDLLSIEGRFTRRGGIDINPFRSSHSDMRPLNTRQLRQ
ncbi:MAG TPA: NADPH-dependent 7-cyano-7-deazaguanine reductase QueF [Pseudomonadales bacterium]|nr:NADPH-dependent 7-cyano-7-deazaguanine reductase QueF [Pseudomonadales bacterium]